MGCSDCIHYNVIFIIAPNNLQIFLQNTVGVLNLNIFDNINSKMGLNLTIWGSPNTIREFIFDVIFGEICVMNI